MNVAARHPMSLAEFLAWEERQEAGIEIPLAELYEDLGLSSAPGQGDG